jgi:hypothetical protein
MGIDFMWHTHMSAPELYLPDTIQHAGKFLNHHDTVPDSVLSDNFAYPIKASGVCVFVQTKKNQEKGKAN